MLCTEHRSPHEYFMMKSNFYFVKIHTTRVHVTQRLKLFDITCEKGILETWNEERKAAMWNLIH